MMLRGAWLEMLLQPTSSFLLRVGSPRIAHDWKAEMVPLLCLQSCVDHHSAFLSYHLASYLGWFR